MRAFGWTAATVLLLLLLLLSSAASIAIAAASIAIATPLPVNTRIAVFGANESGYFCIKIPYLLVTLRGSLLALGEGRIGSCGDYTETHLVLKRSTNGGLTWSPLTVLHSEGPTTVIGNAAPIQLRNGRILIPFCRNNSVVLQTFSDDDGVTFAPIVEFPNATLPSWQWIGLGPPAGLQLASGRLVVCAYHDPNPHWDDGDLSHGHVIISDNFGESWRVGGEMTGVHFSNECQIVELAPNMLLANSRGLLGTRLLTQSVDGGETFGATSLAVNLTEPLAGCEGSMLRHSVSGVLYYTGLSSPNTSPLRYGLTLYCSKDAGQSWRPVQEIDAGPTAYSALVELPDPGHNSLLGLLYEWADPPVHTLFVPSNMTFMVLNASCN